MWVAIHTANATAARKAGIRRPDYWGPYARNRAAVRVRRILDVERAGVTTTQRRHQIHCPYCATTEDLEYGSFLDFFDSEGLFFDFATPIGRTKQKSKKARREAEEIIDRALAWNDILEAMEDPNSSPELIAVATAARNHLYQDQPDGRIPRSTTDASRSDGREGHSRRPPEPPSG